MSGKSILISVLLCLAAIPLSVLAKDWKGLSFDDKHFMCNKWDDFCETVLDDIDCAVESRQMEGCANYPEEKSVENWVGKCTCLDPIPYYAGTRVTQQLLSNRILPDMAWLMEPWSSGPPYDIIVSYKGICRKMLHRIDCPEEYQTIYASDTETTTQGDNFACTCGNLTTPSSFVNSMMMDKMNDYNLRSTPIFSNPVYLSVPMSICIILIVGKLGAIIAVYLKLPPIIGFLLMGLGIQNILNPMFLKGAGFPYPSPASELKLIALVIVLMRAGLEIKIDEIYANGLTTFLLSTVPYMIEFFTFMYYGAQFFPTFSIISMGLFASIMVPQGPSVIISGMLNMMASPKRNPGYAGKQILISTPIEAVLSIVLFGIFSNLEQTGVKNRLWPWVEGVSLVANVLLIPLNLIFSSVMGIIIGYVASKYIVWRSKQKNDLIWYRVSKNPQMGSSTADLVFVLLTLCYTMMSLCTNQYIQQSSGVLVVFVASITVSKITDAKLVKDIALGLKAVWLFAEVFLFVLTGTSLSFNSSNGPLYGQRGLAPDMMQQMVQIMFVASITRFAALGFCVACIYPTLPPHRKQWQWWLPFWFNIYIFQLPKATVHATLGSVAYYQKIIPGKMGFNQGLIIAQSTAFSVLLFAPLGTLMTNYVGCPLALHCVGIDKAAGWDEETRTYISDKKVEDAKPVEEGDSEGGVQLQKLDNVDAIDDGAMNPLHQMPKSVDDVVKYTSAVVKLIEDKIAEEVEEDDLLLLEDADEVKMLVEPETIEHHIKDAARFLFGIEGRGAQAGNGQPRRRSVFDLNAPQPGSDAYSAVDGGNEVPITPLSTPVDDFTPSTSYKMDAFTPSASYKTEDFAPGISYKTPNSKSNKKDDGLDFL